LNKERGVHFPLSDVTVSPFLLSGVGFLVGLLGGFFGVGGGFLAGPMMLLIGVPGNFVVGTDLAHMTGKSIVAARRHSALGHVDLMLGAVMIAGTAGGIEAGARIVEYLEGLAPGVLETVLRWVYLVLLLGISVLVFIEGFRATRVEMSASVGATETLSIDVLSRRIQSIRLPPLIRLSTSGIESISVWVILGIGFVTGLLVGMLGVGGGFIRMPALVYVLGVPTHVAVGTDLFEIVFSAGYGTLTHALKGNVDILMALIMQTGAAIGAQLGALGTRYISGPRLRIAFAFLPFIGAVLLLADMISGGRIH
jgi:uncharacterized membrane protein YfcA